MAGRRRNRREFMKSCGAALAAAAAVPAAVCKTGTSMQGATVPQETGAVVIYPAPEGEVLSSDYTVEVNGQPVPVYNVESRWHDKKYSAAYFDFTGAVTIRIRCNLPEAQADPLLRQLTILPALYEIRPTVANGVATFTTDRHFNISFEPLGERSPLHLFTNPIERDHPNSSDPNVVYFGPGIHRVGRIDLKSGQTLYIAGGAIVKAAVTSTGDNISIMGRGILDGNDWPHFQGPATRMLWPCDGRNIVVRDIIIRGAWTWTVAPTRCDEVLISNLRICGSRCGNDDGIDICNCSNVKIRNCFIHTDDDGIAVKGVAEGDQEPRASQNILVETCTFWVDFANGFRLGAESRARACRNFTAKDIEFIHFPSRRQISVIYLHPEDNMPMDNLVFAGIRIRQGDLLNLAWVAPMLSQSEEKRRQQQLRASANHWRVPGTGPYQLVPGSGPYIHNVVFKDIEVVGTRTPGPPFPRIQLQGLSKEHNVQGISFENVILYGHALSRQAQEITKGTFVEQVRIDGDSLDD